MDPTWNYPYRMLYFLVYLVKSRGYTEWGTEEDGYTKEYWGRKRIWVLRPRFGGFIKRLPCGCSKRFGKFVYYRYRCVEQHGNFNKYIAKWEAANND